MPSCKDQPIAIWFDYDQGEQPFHVALQIARDYCDNCPVRHQCLVDCMKHEGNDSAEYRAGIYAGLTPQQRHSLHKRGADFDDPRDLRKGKLAIPDRGDLWIERHTKLARMTIQWLMWNIEVGAEVPAALVVSRAMKVGVKDLRRVFQALKEDHVLKRINGVLVYNAEVASVDRWLPKHLRKKAK
jgi:hypothetical protein